MTADVPIRSTTMSLKSYGNGNKSAWKLVLKTTRSFELFRAGKKSCRERRMKTMKKIQIWSLAVLLGALGASVAFVSGCRVRATPGRVRVSTPSVRVSGPVVRVRTSPPPPKREAARACPPGSFWRQGQWRWDGSRWAWARGRCERIPPKYKGRRGCRWQPGRWVKVRDGYRRQQGRWVCR